MKQATKTVSNLKYDLFRAIGHQECITRAKFLEVVDVGELLKKNCRHCIQICYLHKK